MKTETSDIHTPFNPSLIERETARVEIFSDAVFAIVITLLVLDIKVPDNYAESPFKSIIQQYPAFEAYFLSFLTIGVYWVAHHSMFNFIKKSNRTMMWLNLVFLMFIALIPFPTRLISHFDGLPTSALLYGLLLILINISLFSFWSYVANNHRLVSPYLPDEAVAWIKLQIYIALLFVFVGVVCSFFSPHLSFVIYALIVIRFAIPSNINKMIARMRAINKTLKFKK